MLNVISLMGRLTKDPECRTTPSGTSVASWYLAVDRDYKLQDGTRPTDFFTCIAWKGTADLARQYLKKGRLITVTGRMEMRDFQDKNGNARRAYEVNVQGFYFGDSAKPQQSAQQTPQGAYPPQQGYQPPQPPQQQYQQQDAFSQMGQQVPFDEEVPF
jgi:single-strand DNA-binding protein